MTNRKVDGKTEPTGKKSWAEVLKAEGFGVDREQERCSAATDVHPAAQQFAGAPGYLSMGVYPVSTKPKRKPKCVPGAK